MDDARLATIAAAVGTPAYVYDADAIRARYRELTAAFAGRIPAHIHYSVKANSNLAILRLLRSLGAGADIVSGGELTRALAAGFPPRALVFSGVGKTAAELEQALAAGVGLINVESGAEADLVACLAERAGGRARLGIRVNPDVTTETHRYTQTGVRGMKFGVPLDEAAPLARRLRDVPYVELASIGMHIGSQITSADPYRLGAAKLAALVAEVRASGIASLTSVDVGGGLGIAYGDGAAALTPEAFVAAVRPLHEATQLPVLVEPGRFLVGGAGVLLTRVLYRKHSGGRNVVIADAGMNDLLRPSLYQAVHPIRVLGETTGEETLVDIVGPICETGDFLGVDRQLRGAEPGALLAVGGAGAYAFSMSSQYNSRPRAVEVLADGNRWGVIREREQPPDLVRGEHVEPRWIE
ncbi:MAG: diaminopimelate decarboxylase [Gemmatimonadota bacterium]|nr:diaminopimelate decarboxylase [Gemmatimonadota bacterium]